MERYNLDLTREEIALLIQCASKQSWEVVNDVIVNIQTQVNEQHRANNTKESADIQRADKNEA